MHYSSMHVVPVIYVSFIYMMFQHGYTTLWQRFVFI